MMKTKQILWLILAVLSLAATGCPVSVNDTLGDDGGDDGPGTEPECAKTDLSTVRFFHAAGGTPVTRPEFGPSSTRPLQIVRPDLLDADGEPTLVTTMNPGRASIVQLCGNKMLMLGARLAGADANRVTTMVTLIPDANPSAFNVGTTIILAGISDALMDDGVTPENPASVANPLRFIVVPDTFDATPQTQIRVVHASRKTPIRVDIEVNPDSMGAEFMMIDRYAVTGVTATKGTTDAAPGTVPVAFLEGTMTKASFTISPRIPVDAKVLAIHFDTEVYDPDNEDPAARMPAPTARLFVTGDDPLLGSVAGGGVQF